MINHVQYKKTVEIRRRAKYCTIMTDEAADISNREQLVSHEKFIDPIGVYSITAEIILKVLNVCFN